MKTKVYNTNNIYIYKHPKKQKQYQTYLHVGYEL